MPNKFEGMIPLGKVDMAFLMGCPDAVFESVCDMLLDVRSIQKSDPDIASHILRRMFVDHRAYVYDPGDEPPIDPKKFKLKAQQATRTRKPPEGFDAEIQN